MKAKYIIGLIAALALAGCSDPGAKYLGRWVSQRSHLDIHKDGTALFKITDRKPAAVAASWILEDDGDAFLTTQVLGATVASPLHIAKDRLDMTLADGTTETFVRDFADVGSGETFTVRNDTGLAAPSMLFEINIVAHRIGNRLHFKVIDGYFEASPQEAIHQVASIEFGGCYRSPGATNGFGYTRTTASFPLNVSTQPGVRYAIPSSGELVLTIPDAQAGDHIQVCASLMMPDGPNQAFISGVPA